MRISDGARNAELDLRAGIQLAPHIQAPSYQIGAFAHAVQAVMSGSPVLSQNLWVDAFSVIPNAHPELPVIVPDFHFDLLCLCMLECIAHRFAGNPEHFVALENLGNAYRVEKRWEEARAELEKALALKPEDPEANYSLGMVFAQTDQTEAAYECLRKALQYRPAYPEALNNLGVLYLRTGHTQEAIERFEECIRVAPLFDQSYLNLARVYEIQGESGRARTVLLELLKQRPGHVQAQQALAQLK